MVSQFAQAAGLKRINRHDNHELTESELVALWWEYVADRDNHELRNRLLSHYHHLVTYGISLYLRRRDMPLNTIDEYVSAGWIGLLNAASKYHPGKPSKFATYAVNGVIWELIRVERKSNYGIDRRASLAKHRRMASHSLGMRANDQDLAEHLRTTEQRITTLSVRAANTRQILSGEQAADRPARHVPDPSDRITVQDSLEQALGLLPERERDLMQRMTDEGKSQNEVAAESGISRQRIHQVYSRAMERIRERFNKSGTAHEFTQERFFETVAKREPLFTETVAELRKARVAAAIAETRRRQSAAVKEQREPVQDGPVRSPFNFQDASDSISEIESMKSRLNQLTSWLRDNPGDQRAAGVRTTVDWLKRQIAKAKSSPNRKRELTTT